MCVVRLTIRLSYMSYIHEIYFAESIKPGESVPLIEERVFVRDRVKKMKLNCWKEYVDLGPCH